MKEILRQQFQASYKREAFEKNVLRSIFQGKVNEYVILDDKTAFSIPLTEGEKTIAKSITKYGHVITADDRKIELYEVVLKDDKLVERNKVSIGALVKKQIIGNNAIFVNFTYENPEDKNWRFSFIAFDSVFEDGDIKTIETNPKRYTYIFGEPDETYKTAVDCFFKLANEFEIKIAKIKDAFGVEAMSKAFFDEYRDTHYKNFVNHLIHSNFKKSAFDGDEKAIRDFVKKLLGRIVFLYFLQKKGWLGATTLEYNDGDKNFISNFFREAKQGTDFYPVWLSKLFFDTLNEKRIEDNFTMPDGSVVKIPYLNGGLFEKDSDKVNFITFEPELFASLFDFFDQYNFTVYEDSPDDHTVAVDPEMLGHIFENLLEDNKDKGAFYTPKQIVQYMTQESLIEYLNTHLSTEKYKISNYIKDNQAKLSTQELKDIDVLLDNVKICDPAIGSGAFPMGLLQEIFSLKERIAFELGFKVWSPATVKENIIQNSIYGVDIEKGAVDIARLRFWLSLIVDEDLPKALPNLDYKIVVGNSLVSKFQDEVIEIDWGIKEGTQSNLFGYSLEEDKQQLLKEISDKQKQFFHTESKDKKKLASEIRTIKIKLLRKQLELMIETKGFKEDRGQILNKKQLEAKLETESWKNTLEDLKRLEKNPNLPFNHFDWKLDFPEILNPIVAKGNFGFDIVIANPPYVGVKGNKTTFDLIKKSKLNKYFKGRAELFYFFMHKAIELGKENCINTFITTNYFITSTDGNLLRQNLKEETSIISLLNFNEVKIFATALGQHNMITIFKKGIDNEAKAKTFITKAKGFLSDSKLNDILNFRDDDTDYYELNQNDIFEGKEHYIRTVIDSNGSNIMSKIFNSIKKGVLLEDLCHVRQGMRTGIDRVSDSHINKIDSSLVKGDGVFILSKEEIEKLKIDKNDTLVKPLFKNSDINKYFSNTTENQYLLYIDNSIELEDLKSNHLPIYNHLSKYKKTISTIRDKNNENNDDWFRLDRPREKWLFEGEKIVAPQRSRSNKFAYNDISWYASADVYFIKQKSKDVSLKYILALLNSKLYYYWLLNKGKRKGDMLELYQKPLSEIPIVESKEFTKHIETIIDYILIISKEKNLINIHVPNNHIIEVFEELLDAIIFQIYFPDDFKEKNIDILKFLKRDIIPVENSNLESQIKIIHETYQKLREKSNEIRNNIKLMKIELRDLLMPLLTV